MAVFGALLFVVGAILAWGIKLVVDGVDLVAIGVILMVAGAIVFVAGLVTQGGFGFGGRRMRSERHVSADGRHVVDETTTRDF